MKMTRDNFGVLLTPVHKKIIWDAYREKPEQFSKLFKVDTMTMKQETYPHLGGFGMWDTNTEGNTINEDNMSEGNTATFIAERYDKGYSITWELVQDDLKNVMKGLGKGGSAKALGKGLRVRIEKNCADIINNGFTNVGYDSVSLFDDSHPLADSGSLGDNLITGALSDANLKLALTKMRTETLDEAGLLAEAMADIAWCGAANEFTLYTILHSAQIAGSANNDKNVLPNLRPVVLDYVNTAWGVADSSFDNLKFKWREKPIFDSQPIPKTVDTFMYGYARFDEGYEDWRGVVGSTGT